MTDIIEKLYEEMRSERSIQIEECGASKDLYDADEMLWDKVQPLLGRTVVEELQGSQDKILMRSNLEWFRRGVRAGMTLMLEVL